MACTPVQLALVQKRCRSLHRLDDVLRDVVYGSNGLIGLGIRTHEPLAELRSQAYAAIETKRLLGLHLPLISSEPRRATGCSKNPKYFKSLDELICRGGTSAVPSQWTKSNPCTRGGQFPLSQPVAGRNSKSRVRSLRVQFGYELCDRSGCGTCKENSRHCCKRLSG